MAGTMNHQKSEQLYERAKKCLPGGVNSPVRAYLAVGRAPVFIERAKGPYIYDVDGNSYIDYVGSWGPCILGHAHPQVTEAVRRASENGLTYGAPTQKEIEIAEMIRDCMPSMEVSRLVSSGTEAVMSAVRVARGFTGRDKIVKFRGCYHGHADDLLVKAGSGALTQSVPDSLGVPADCTKNTLIAEYNDEASVQRLFETNRGQIAALIVEPVAANMGVVPPAEGFLPFLREITRQNGALLIFDEVITGFRLGLGGAQQYYGVEPDLTTLGKIVGGGMPMGAYGGRREIMHLVAPAGPVYQAGTLSGNPIATAAGITTLRLLREQPQIYDKIAAHTETIADAVKDAFGDQVQVNRVGSLMSVFFTGERVTNYETATTSDTVKYARYFGYLLEHGIYTAPSQFEAMFLSAAHQTEDIEKTCDVVRSYQTQLSMD